MCNDINSDGTEQIALALQVWFYLFFYLKFKSKNKWIKKKNNSLVYLNLNGNKIGNKGGMCLAQMLQVNISLQYLDIGETDLVWIYFNKKHK